VLGPAPSVAAGEVQRIIPIRNLAPPPPKKRNPVVTILTAVGVVVVLGVAVYFGYPYIKKMMEKPDGANPKTAEARQGAQSAPMQEVSAAMDLADPGAGSEAPPPSNPRKSGPGRRQGRGGPPSTGAAKAGQSAGAPVWTLDVTAANIPETPVSGRISGSSFAVETARFDPVGTAQVLRLIQGQLAAPDRDVLVYLSLGPGEKPGGQNLTIGKDAKATGVAQVIERWKPNPTSPLQTKSFTSGYALRLDLDQPSADGLVAGKIFLALPDTEQSFVAGTFKATVNQPQGAPGPGRGG
jgi:hypothetical protein